MFGLFVNGRQEDDRNSLSLLAFSYDLCSLVPVQIRHENVEQNDGELALQKLSKSLFAGVRNDDLADVLEHRRNCKQIALVVVDDEDPWPKKRMLYRRLRLPVSRVR